MNRSSILAAVAALTIATPGLATVGYFAHGYGTQSKGMGGAGVGFPSSSITPATNPAGLAFVSARVDLGAALFSPDRRYTVSGAPSGYQGTMGLAAGSVVSGSKNFAVPTMGAAWEFGPETRVGLALFGNGGMNTDYPGSTFYGGKTGVDLQQAFVMPTYARLFAGKHAFGISPIFAYQTFEARGLAAFSAMSSNAACLSNRGHDTSHGFGARVGYLGQLTPRFAIGAGFQSRLAMSKFNDYCGLFAEDGSFDIPMNWTAGVAGKPLSALTLAADVQEIYYSDVNSVGNAMLPNLGLAQLGQTNGAGFGWRDMTIVKLGAEYAMSPALTVRGGYAYGRQPIPKSEVMMNILAPGVMEQHATLGATRSFGRTALSVAVTRAFTKSVEGANPLEAPGQQSIKLEMDQWDVDLGLSFGL